MTIKRMDNVGIVVADLDAAVAFFVELGLTLEGRMDIDGEWAVRSSATDGSRRAHSLPRQTSLNGTEDSSV